MIVELAPAVADLAPGEELAFDVLLTNDGEQAVRSSLRFDGIAPEQIWIGSVPVELPVGASADVPCVLRLPADANAGDWRVRVTVRDLNDWTPAVTVGLDLFVGDRPDVSVQIVPPATTGRRSGVMTTVVHNRSTQPLPLALDGDADALAFGFAADDIVIGPGEELEIDTSVVPLRRTWFRELRHGGLIRVRGDGAPVSASMTFTQRPWIPPLLTKIVAAITVLAVWAAAVIVVVDFVADEEQDPSKLLAMSPAAAEAFARAADGFDAPELVPATQRGPGPSVQGAVTGPTDPAGTTIVLERVALGDQGTTTQSNVKLAAFTPVQQQIGNVLDRIETSTDDQGNFRIADGLQLPGFYRVTALRTGYEVASQVVTLTAELAQAEIAMELTPATGGLSGTVRDENGSPIGGADIEVTDGSLTYTATSDTEGSVGSWSIGGVAAPSVYEVVVSARGYASASLRVPLEGGQQAAGIDAVLQGGLGTIRGQVSNRGEGVGAITVDLVGEDNDVERTTTTITDDGLAGRFDIPALPFGTYLLTFSGEGWLTQTAEVVVDRGDVEVAVSDLRSATAVLQGTVHQEVLPGGDCAYPDPERPGDRDRVQLEPCGGVGVSVIGADQTWRTTSASGTGTFQISRVPPGEYLVRFERAGYVAQFYEVVVGAGDVVTLPDDASTITPDSVDASVVAMRLTPDFDRRAGQIQGVIRNANVPADAFEPPAGTRIQLVDEPDAVIERLADGVFRFTSVPAGVQTIRIEAPGFDIFERRVRVPAEGMADAGALAITPLGSLDLRVAGGQTVPVGGADIFVAPDPAVYDNDADLPLFEAAEQVRTCSRTFRLDDELVTLDGVCVTTDGVGDASFRRTFSTGNYVLATPVNDPANDAANNRETRAQTVPLDHELLVRRVDIESGATVRLDLTLRRYAVITGLIRRPAGDREGIERVDVDEGDITFELIDADTGQTITPYPEGLPQPRISFDDNSDLPIGRYRIDRIPADTGDRQFTWRLAISSGGDERIWGPDGQEEAIAGLQYNEIRTLPALLVPGPQAIRFEATYAAVGQAEPQPVLGAGFQIFGVSNFEDLEGNIAEFAPIVTLCAGPACEVSTGDTQFDYTSATSSFVEQRAVSDAGLDPESPLRGANLWLRGDSQGPVGTFRIPPFYRPGEVTFRIDAPGFETLPEEVITIEAPDEDGDIVIARTLNVEPRDVTGTVALLPFNAFFRPYLADFGVSGDADILETLEATLTPTDDADGSVTVGVTRGGTFRFDGTEEVFPGSYLLSITSIDGQSPTFVEEIADQEILIPPGTSAFGIPPADTQLQRTGIIRVAATDASTSDGPLSGVEVALSRTRNFSGDPYEPVGDPLVTCEDETSNTGGPACGPGLATFAELPLTAPEGTPWRYQVEVDRDGYVYRGSGLLAVPNLDLDTYTLFAPSLDRFGEVAGTLRGKFPSDAAPDPSEPLVIGDATITLVDAYEDPVEGRQPILDADGDPITATFDAATGEFVFANTLEIPPRVAPLTGSEQNCELDATTNTIVCTTIAVPAEGDRYALRLEAPGYETREPATTYTFELNTRETVPAEDAVLDVLPGTLVVNVRDTDGVALLDARIDLFAAGADVATATPLRTEYTTDATATFGLLEPRDYRLLLTVGTGDSEADFVATDRPTQEVDTTVVATETTTETVNMPPPLGALAGTIELELFAGSSEPVDFSAVRVRARRNSNAGGGPVDVTVQTEADGSYTFPGLREGEYTVTFTRNGYGMESRGPITVDSNASAIVPLVTLTAATVTTTVTVDSDGGGALQGVEVTATYDGDGPAPASSPFSDVTDVNGQVAFDLPPVDWRFTTDDATLLQPPHNDLEAPGQLLELDVPDPEPPETVTEERTATATITLERYARISGVTLTRPSSNVTAIASDEVTVSSDDPLGVEVRSGDEGAFEYYVPVPPDADLTLTFDADGYGQETFVVTEAALADGEAAAGNVVLTALTRPVEVVFQSSANGGSLDGLTAARISASAAVLGAGSVRPDTVVLSDANRTLTATFDALPPGDWTVETLEADQLDQRHDNGSVSFTLDVWDEQVDRLVTIGAAEDPFVPIVLDRLVRIEGSLAARLVADGGDQPLPTDVAVTVTPAGGTTIDADLDAATGIWSVIVARVGDGVDLAFDATGTGYDASATESVLAAGWSDDLLAADDAEVALVLIATEVEGVVAEVVSSVEAVEASEGVDAVAAVGGLNGVVVTATYTDADYDAEANGELTRTATTATVGDVAGIATLTLPPGSWTLTTGGAAGALDGGGDAQPHGNETDGVIIEVPLGGPPPAATEIELDPFVEISGTLEPVAFLGGPRLTTLTNPAVSVSDGIDSFAGTVSALIDDIDDTNDGLAEWSASIPPNIAADVTLSADDYDDTVVEDVVVGAADVDLAANPALAAQIAATPREVTVTVDSSDGGISVLENVDVVGAWQDGPPAPTDEPPADLADTTDASGEATLLLPPGQWALTTENGAGATDPNDADDPGLVVAHFDAVVGVDTAGEVEAAIITVALGDASRTETITLNPNSVLVGVTVEQRGDTKLAVAGVEVIAERDGERFSTTSGVLNADGDNYRLRARAGIWRITAIHEGEQILVDEAFEIRKDGPGTEPNRLEIVVPTRSIALEGQIVDDTDQGVEGAQVRGVSSIGTVTTTSDADGRYSLDGLDNTVTWAVTFTPPAELDARPVTRWIALNGDESADVQLDQRLPVGLGEIELRLTGGQPSSTVAVALSEATPFPTLNAEGRVEVAATLDGDGAGVVRFENLVPGDGRSVPQSRFTLEIVAPDADRVVRPRLDVGPGQTTVVEVDLDALIDLRRDVELTLTDDGDGEPITNRSVTLENGTSTVVGTVEPDSNRYRFAAVEPGSWQVVARDYEAGTIVVPEGDGTFAADLALTAIPTDEEPADELDAGSADGSDEPLDTDDPDTTPQDRDEGSTTEDPGAPTSDDEPGDDGDDVGSEPADPVPGGSDDAIVDDGSGDPSGTEEGDGVVDGSADAELSGDGSGPSATTSSTSDQIAGDPDGTGTHGSDDDLDLAS